MTRRCRSLEAIIVLFAISVSGCAHHEVCCPPQTYDSEMPRVSQNRWPDAERAPPPSVASSIPAYSDALAAVPSRLTNEQFRGITPIEAQCRAAEFAPIANLMLSESDAAEANAVCDPDGECSGPLKRELLEMRSIDERNKAARNALQLFYRLAEAEAGIDAINRSLPILDRSLEDVQRMRQQGLTLNADPSAIERQRYELLNQREDVQLAILQLNDQLGQILGLDRPEDVRFWPEMDWGIQVEPLNIGTHLSIGMSQRADLAMLRRMEDGLNASTVSAARQVLALANVGLGQASPATFVFSHKKRCACAACEVPVRQEQLEALTAHQEETAAAEIRQAAYTVETRIRQAAITADTLKSLRGRLDDVRTLRRVDRATAFEVYTAELAVIEGEADLLRAIIAVKLAEVDLEAAQGMLAVDCGYSVNGY